MKSKMLTILISMLFVSIIPSVVGVYSELEKEPCLDVSRIFLKGGFVLFLHYSGYPHNPDENLICFAIRLMYIEITPTERNFDWITFKWVKFENVRITTGPFGILGYIYSGSEFEILS